MTYLERHVAFGADTALCAHHLHTRRIPIHLTPKGRKSMQEGINTPKRITVVMLSDTHEQHRKAVVPNGDLLIHAGDFTYFDRVPKITEEFNAWLGELPHRHKIVVPGNHESRKGRAHWIEKIPAATVLVNDGIEIEGIRIWVRRIALGTWAHSAPASRVISQPSIARFRSIPTS